MRSVGLSVLLAVTAAACGGSASSPVSPSPTPSTPVSVVGAWSGTSTDSVRSEQMGLNLTQVGTSVTGTMTFADAGRGMMGNGTMQGTMNGSAVTFHMAVPAGGFSGSMSPCSMGIDATATISADGMTMTGTYSGQLSGMMPGMMSQMQTCGGTMTNGRFTLTR